MILEIILAIMGILGLIVMLMQILKYFTVTTRTALIVALTGATSLGLIDTLMVVGTDRPDPRRLIRYPRFGSAPARVVSWAKKRGRG